MSFTAAVERLNALGLELAPGAPRRKFELAHMRTLAAALGDPETKFPSLLIAGTNGKGSTAATLASILAAAGYRTGLYTSPHLERVTERLRLSTPKAVVPSDAESKDPCICPSPFSEIPEPDFARLYFRVDEAGRRLVVEGHLPQPPSYFETLTALASLYFAERQVDIAVLEVGLGGRLDATNIVEPLLSIITDIALDHQEYLGPTIAAIAREKAGILRPGGTLITLPQHPEANQAIGEVATELNVRGVNAAQYLPGRDFRVEGHAFTRAAIDFPLSCHPERAENVSSPRVEGPASETSPLTSNSYSLSLDGETLRVRSPLHGEHQQRNIALAIAAAIALRNGVSYKYNAANQERYKKSYNIHNAAIESGIAHTSWAGRLEFLPPNLLLDVAHNPAGAWTLRAALSSLPESQPRTLLFSCLRDKDLREIAQILFPLFDSDQYSPCAPSVRAADGWDENASEQPQPRHHIVLTPVGSPRAASLNDLLATARALNVQAYPAANPAEALTLARQLTPPGGIIVATGSIYLVGAVRSLATLAHEQRR